VTLYCLLHGHCPFEADCIVNLYHKILHDSIKINENLSQDFQDLIKQMLQKDPNARITVPEIKLHPWVTTHGTEPMMSTEENCVFEDVTEEEVQNAINIFPKVKLCSRYHELDYS
jgi:serine/threonine protein kinase